MFFVYSLGVSYIYVARLRLFFVVEDFGWLLVAPDINLLRSSMRIVLLGKDSGNALF